MIKILFVCHGNICRSPMAEFVFRDMVQKQGLGDRFHVASAATSREEIARTIGFDSPEISETIGEGVTQLIFVEEDRVVLCICAYPENLGYDVDFTGCVRYGEHTPFTVRQGSVVRLSLEPA